MTDTSLPITLKWSKQTFSMTIEFGEASDCFKERVHSLTGVPVARQKLLAKKGGWKGALKDGALLSSTTLSNPSVLTVVTLIGSAEILAAPAQVTTFVEDLSTEDLLAEEEAQAQAAMATAQGMIPSLQLPPHRRDDGKQEWYSYNRLVSGLPQRRIEHEMTMQQSTKGNSTSPEYTANMNELQGRLAMNMGLELRRGYVNDLAVLEDGTCVSALDDGHVQLWKHASQQQDIMHPGNEGGVNSVVALRRYGNSPLAFATVGRGCLQLWSSEADPMMTLPGSMPGTSPASLVCMSGGTNAANDEDDPTICLAARFQITRQSNPMQFRLPPQNDAERGRRAQAEAQEQATQYLLSKAARSIQVWALSRSGDGRHALQSHVLEPPHGLEGSAPITCLTCMSLSSTKLLIAGDAMGGLRMWKRTRQPDGTAQFVHFGLIQLVSTTASSACSIAALEPLPDGRLAVSTNVIHGHTVQLPEAHPLQIPAARAVHIIDLSSGTSTVTASDHSSSLVPRLDASLMGHVQDAVICMCALPNGDLLTGGGKLDATLQLWSKSQLQLPMNGQAPLVSTSHKILDQVGYVFSLTVLSDAKAGSDHYAVAAGRYNTIKIII